MQNNSENSEEKNIELKDLMPGDILIFDGEEDSLISKLIMLFTKSTVTHGAIFMQGGENAALADSGSDGINMHLVTSPANARGVHVRRINKEGGFGEDFDKVVAPVVDIARDYTKQGLPYPYSDLVLLAMIIIYKDVSHVSLKQAAVINLLKLAAAEIKKLLDEKLHDGKHTMVCSSFVYQCYLDASQNNPDLKINIKNGDVDPVLKVGKRTVTLLDLYAEHIAEYSGTRSFAMEPPTPVTEPLQNVLEGLVDTENENHVYLIKNESLSTAIEDFLKSLLKFCGYAAGSVKDLIENAREQQAMFITPNDLYCHTTNTVSIGKVPLDRNSDIYNP